MATPTITQTTLAGLAFNGLDGITPTSRGLLCDAQMSLALVVDCSQAKESALGHWLVNGADGGHLFLRRFGGDGMVRETVAGDVLASLTTMVWNALSKAWTGGATMEDASLNRRRTLRLADAVAFAQIGVVGLDGRIELEALRLYGLPEAAPALLFGAPTLPVGQREFAVDTPLDLAIIVATSILPSGRRFMSKRLQAEEVLNDAKFALVRFHQCADDQERRVLWFSLIGLLRSVGHVLEKVDAPADAELRRWVDAWWPEARKEPIFQDFIEKDRNQFLKAYTPMPRRAVLVSTDGKVLMGSGGGSLTTVEPHIVEGTFAGRPAVEVAGEAVAWWERELAPLTA